MVPTLSLQRIRELYIKYHIVYLAQMAATYSNDAVQNTHLIFAIGNVC